MKFYSSFEPAKCQPCPTGNGKEIDWQLKIVKGCEEVVNAGEIDVYKQIQLSAEASPSISDLVRQYNITHDPSIFESRKDANFFDLTNIPKDIFEFQAMQREAQLKFDQLPIEIKQAYDNNLYNYIQDDKAFDKVRNFISKDFSKRYESMKKPASSKVNNESEVKSNE